MRQVLNDATGFREEMIEGYVAAYGRILRRVPGASGVMVNGAPTPGKVTVIVGGGSGHYPAFYGLVGTGLADAAVIGDIFTSPSGEQAYRVATATDGGAGVLFTFGNYSGDVMNFAAAETRLRADGVDARTVLVTDDVLSSPADISQRRGIAGGFCVFKTAGASANRGDDLGTVEALTRHANDRVRTVGVAFAGCTVPGQREPLFTVPEGMMEVGLGIHGEPGIRTGEMLPAREIAALMVETLLADAPAGAGSQVGVIVNGLGSTKYEEMFVLYQGIAPLLARAGLETYRPHVGEFVTSLDMAGCSLTLFWLDDELLPLWDAPAESPAFVQTGDGAARAWARHEGAVGQSDEVAVSTTLGMDVGAASEESAPGGLVGITARACLGEAARAIEAAEAELGRLDAAVGDGDHGAGMARGFRAAVAATREDTVGAGASLVRAGTAFGDAAGGASGALVGACLVAIGTALPADDAIDAPAVAHALRSGLETIGRLGQASVGDKTMLDTLDPFVVAFERAVALGANTTSAWAEALPAAEAGMRSTVEMVSRRGRSARLGERGRGHVDAGATSMYYVLRAVGDALVER